MNYLSNLAAEIRAEVPADVLPAENSDLLFLAYAMLMLAKGPAVQRADVHNAWVVWMTQLGKKHESLVPFHELPMAVKAEDDPFVEAIRRVAKRRTG